MLEGGHSAVGTQLNLLFTSFRSHNMGLHHTLEYPLSNVTNPIGVPDTHLLAILNCHLHHNHLLP